VLELETVNLPGRKLIQAYHKEPNLGPLLFAIIVNSLLKDWQGRIKYVDDTSALEIIPRCSPSSLPIVVNEISDFAVSRGMKLNPKKCKEMFASFLKYDLECKKFPYMYMELLLKVFVVTSY
jgi:hypothetical protein